MFEDSNSDKTTSILYDSDGVSKTHAVDEVVFGVGAKALSNFVRFCPDFSPFLVFQAFSNLRGTSVLATRIFLSKNIDVPYSANACWGFDTGVGMTLFDISTIHNDVQFEGTILEVDYYHANSLLVLSDEQLQAKVKVKRDVDTILGSSLAKMLKSLTWTLCVSLKVSTGTFQDLTKAALVSYHPTLRTCTLQGIWSRQTMAPGRRRRRS